MHQDHTLVNCLGHTFEGASGDTLPYRFLGENCLCDCSALALALRLAGALRGAARRFALGAASTMSSSDGTKSDALLIDP